MTDSKKLIECAVDAMHKSYAPYSHFNVGAALLCSDGTVYQGCNIENATYTPTVCAERVAFFSAVRDGHRKFEAIAIVGGKDFTIKSVAFPCGVCRQVMREFCDDDFMLYFFDGEKYEQYTLAEILPHSFTPKDLEG